MKEKADKAALGPAFLNEVGKDEYALFRNVILRWTEDGKVVKEEVLDKPLGPLMILRKARKNEQPTMVSSDPRTGEPLPLVKTWDPRDKK